MSTCSRRTYDHRIKQQIAKAGNPELFPEFEIPRSTVRSWIRRGMGSVVSLDPDLGAEGELRARVVVLERRTAVLITVVRLLLALLRTSGFKLETCRVPDAAGKRLLLDAIECARKVMPLSAALRVLRLSRARYHVWFRAEKACDLDDRPSCPRTVPQRLTQPEVEAIGSLVQSKEHRHMSIRALALHAQRVGEVLAHPASWGKLIRRYGWRRPRLRLYPPKPKVGVRALAPNAAWHVDVTIIKLLDGTKAHLHAVIDNFSRRILAWTIADRLDPMNTRDVLVRAASNLEGPMTAEVYMDSGVENLNASVDPLFSEGVLRRVIAQIDVSFSNSMIESWWRSLKHQWLFLHQLDSIATVKRLVEFYVVEHNERMPHSAFHGQTPDEMYFGHGARVPDELAARRQEARKRRLEHNRQQACDRCSRQHEEDVAA